MALFLIQLSTALTVILAPALGIFTLIRNPRSPVNRLWFFTSLAVTAWAAGYLQAMFTRDPNFALLALRLVYTGATLIPIFFVHFLTNFLLQPHAILVAAGYALAAIFLGLINFSNALIHGVRYLPGFGYYEQVGGVSFWLYLGYFGFFTLCSLYLLLTAIAQADGIRQRQLRFLLLATVVGLGGGITNFVLDLTGVFPYGQTVVFLYPLLITYGIFLPKIRIRV